MIFGTEDRYSFAYRLWVKSLIWVDNHLAVPRAATMEVWADFEQTLSTMR